MTIKISPKKKRTYQLVSGIGFLVIGLYMILFLKDVRGQLPFWLGVFLLLWRF